MIIYNLVVSFDKSQNGVDDLGYFETEHEAIKFADAYLDYCLDNNIYSNEPEFGEWNPKYQFYKMRYTGEKTIAEMQSLTLDFFNYVELLGFDSRLYLHGEEDNLQEIMRYSGYPKNMKDRFYIRAINEDGFFANFNSLSDAEKNIVNVLSNEHYSNYEGYSALSYVDSDVDFDNPPEGFYIAKNDEKYQHQKLYFLYTDKGKVFVGDRYFLIDSFYPHDDSRIVKFYDGSWDQSQIVEDIKQYMATDCSADAIEENSHFYISKNCQKWSPDYEPEFVVGSDKIREML